MSVHLMPDGMFQAMTILGGKACYLGRYATREEAEVADKAGRHMKRAVSRRLREQFREMELRMVGNLAKNEVS